jgi:hypothetical protein
MSGGVEVKSCSLIRYIQQVYTKYFARDILYNIHAARKGKLEKIVLKERLVSNFKRTYGRLNVVYKDTYNGLWNESDLIEYADAYALAQAYFEKMMMEAEKLKDC